MGDQGPELYYMRNRWYEPQSGRFLSEDPIGLAGGVNGYVFAGSDPVTARDPAGLAPDRCLEEDKQLDGHCEFRGWGEFGGSATLWLGGVGAGGAYLTSTLAGHARPGVQAGVLQEGCARGFSSLQCHRIREQIKRLVSHTTPLCRTLGTNGRTRLGAGLYIFVGEANFEGRALDLGRVVAGELPAARGRIAISYSGMALLGSTIPHEEYHYYDPSADHDTVYAVGFHCAGSGGAESD